MTDSPAQQFPLDPQEEPILARVLELRHALALLKQDKSTYVKSEDVIGIYDLVIEEVHHLNEYRNRQSKPLESNRVDRVLDDCFQLISLFFLTIGRNNEAPAVYSMSSTIKRLLDHLKEAAFFSAKDLASIGQTLDKMHETLHQAEDKHSPHIVTLLKNRMSACRALLADLQLSLADLSPELAPIHEKLVSILRSIAAANTRSKFPRKEVLDFRDQLMEIKATAQDGKFLSNDGTIAKGQGIVRPLLDRCLLWVDIVLERQGKIDPKFKPTYESLSEIRNNLERLSLTHAWSLREADLYEYQRRLDKFDESRVNGNFEDTEGHKADLFEQRTLLFLLRRSYAYIYVLLISSEPVSQALQPVYNQLQTLRNCLLEVKRAGGVSSARELYPYSMKLSSIDNMRVDGKFKVGADIPEGQTSVIALLNECVEIQDQLRTGALGRSSAV